MPAPEIDLGEDLDQITEEIRDAMALITEAADTLEGVARHARELDLPYWFAGQLEAYTVPHLRRWVSEDSTAQPGNLPGLLDGLAGADGEAGDE